jgi:3-methyladenine DNA glycosylase AlkD
VEVKRNILPERGRVAAGWQAGCGTIHGMNLSDTLRELEKAGSEQTRATYARHGIKGSMFGVSYATLGTMKKKIKTDHTLAKNLWNTGNHDARVLATMIADPVQMSDADLESWIGQLDNRVLTDAFSTMASEALGARRKMQQWINSTDECTSSAGWLVFCRLALKGDVFERSDYVAMIARIERDIAAAPNRTRHCMNNALIAVGRHGGELKAKAVAAAKRIGPVNVDHGDTNCQTPDAASSIAKAATHRAAKKSKPAVVRARKTANKSRKVVAARR